MTLDVADDRIHVTLRPLTGDQRRLTITYPSEYQPTVAAVVADLIRPPQSRQQSITDAERLDWLAQNEERLRDVYWRLQNEETTLREAIDWLAQAQAAKAQEAKGTE